MILCPLTELKIFTGVKQQYFNVLKRLPYTFVNVLFSINAHKKHAMSTYFIPFTTALIKLIE